MPLSNKGVHSRVLLERLKVSLAKPGKGQDRLDRIVMLIASSMDAEVCSIYLKKNQDTLELFATQGLKPDAVHFTKLKVGQGLVGQIAKNAKPINTSNAPKTKGYYFIPEIGEESYPSFLGVAIQRLGEILGVLIVQNNFERNYTQDEVYGLEIVAMVIAEMTELGAFSDGIESQITAQHNHTVISEAIIGNEGISVGKVLLHDPIINIENPIANNPRQEKLKLSRAFKELKKQVKNMIEKNFDLTPGEHIEIFEVYQMFANDKGWRKRIEASIEGGLAATVAVEKEQSETRTRMSRLSDPYIRERLHDLDDISNRLLRILTKTDVKTDKDSFRDGILVAKNLGPAELLDYGSTITGVVLEEGSVGSHATIVARALGIPMVIKVERLSREARNGDIIILDANVGKTYLRPEQDIVKAYNDKISVKEEAEEKYLQIKDELAITKDNFRIGLLMNAGLMLDFEFLEKSGAEGIGLYRTELQFLTKIKFPKRAEQAKFYSQILDTAGDLPVNFRTLDIGSDKVLPYFKRPKEPNPALGWRAIRIGLERSGILRMQIQALLRGAKGRPLRILFPFVAELNEFKAARKLVLDEVKKEKSLNHNVPDDIKIGSMLETPSLAFESDRFFELADFISIGGNDLKQCFFAADRENELVRSRYDTLNTSYLEFIRNIVARADSHQTPINFCGEDAGRPLEAVALLAVGLRTLSMRASSIGPVKLSIRNIFLSDVKEIFDNARTSGKKSIREDLSNLFESQKIPFQ